MLFRLQSLHPVWLLEFDNWTPNTLKIFLLLLVYKSSCFYVYLDAIFLCISLCHETLEDHLFLRGGATERYKQPNNLNTIEDTSSYAPSGSFILAIHGMILTLCVLGEVLIFLLIVPFTCLSG